MSISTQPRDAVAVYRDDGPLARALGRSVGAALPLASQLLVLLALAPLVVVAAVWGGEVSQPVAAALLAWVLLTAGASSGARPPRRARWTEPPLIRTTEYVALFWIAAVHGASAYPGAYALIAVLTFRHYDLVYRLRHRGVTPARWVSALAGGWDGRVVAAFLLLAAGALPAGYYIAAGTLAVAFVGEAASGWVAAGPGEQPPADEEGDEL